MGKPKGPMNLRDYEAKQSTGQDGDGNTFIEGMSGKTAAEKATNATDQYWTGPAGAETKANLGGEARDN